MSEQLAPEPAPARVAEAYDQMMRQVIGPALRQFGFRGTLREFKYGSRNCFGTVVWQKSGRDVVRAQVLRFTANVNWCGADRIGELMPVPATDTWWQITGGRSYDSVAESVISAVRRYALPAIQAGLEDPERPDADMRWSRAFGPGGVDGGGAAASSWFVPPAGTEHDGAFAWFASSDPGQRLDAAEIVTARAADDPRTPAALVERLGRDPNPMVRKLIASRMLSLMTGHPEVVSALEAAAATDNDTGVRWAARYALRLSGNLMADASTSWQLASRQSCLTAARNKNSWIVGGCSVALADLARETYAAGWALSGGPMTCRVPIGCLAAVQAALENADDPHVLEATLQSAS